MSTLLSLREELLLRKFERTLSFPRAIGLVGEVEQAVSTGLLGAGTDNRAPSQEPLPSADDLRNMLLIDWPPSGGSLENEERCLPTVLSGESNTSNTLSGDCMLSHTWLDFEVMSSY